MLKKAFLKQAPKRPSRLLTKKCAKALAGSTFAYEAHASASEAFLKRASIFTFC